MAQPWEGEGMSRHLLPRFADGMGRIFLALILVFLYVPIAVLALMGFNESVHYALPFEFSTKWYEALAGNERLLTASFNSVWIALANTVVATTIGTTTTTRAPRNAHTGPTGPLTGAPVERPGYEQRRALVVKIDNYAEAIAAISREALIHAAVPLRRSQMRSAA